MSTEMILPKVDMDQETGTIVEWKKNNGDEVKEGETILVIETDKVAIDVEAPASGILQGITSKSGDVLPIATVIAHILKPGEELPASAKSAPAAAAPVGIPTPAVAPAPAVPAPSGGAPVQATPIAQKMAADMGVNLSSLTGSGAQGKITKEDVVAAAESAKAAPVGGKVNAVPAARRAAREQGVDLASVSGSGPKGRIQSPDVLSAAQSAGSTVAAAALQSDQVIPLVGMRRTIAERMTASYQNVPHITFNTRVDMTEFNKARKALNRHAESTGGQKISATALLTKIVAMTLVRHPWLNSSLQNENIVLYKEVNMGVAVALEEGLIVPVVHSVQLKGIAQIAAEVNDLAERAREGSLLPGDVKGGTFTISNLGPFGVESFSAIINAPQAAILAVGATFNEAVPLDSGEIVSRPVMNITLSADHRIVDGAVAAYFIADLKEALENPILATY